MLQTGRSKQILKSRKSIKPIIEAIMLCRRQNIPLRGYDDRRDGSVLTLINKIIKNIFVKFLVIGYGKTMSRVTNIEIRFRK